MDFPALRALVDCRSSKASSFWFPRLTGEAQTLDAAERERVVAAVVEVSAGRIPVMAGATSNDTRLGQRRCSACAGWVQTTFSALRRTTTNRVRMGCTATFMQWPMR